MIVFVFRDVFLFLFLLLLLFFYIQSSSCDDDDDDRFSEQVHIASIQLFSLSWIMMVVFSHQFFFSSFFTFYVQLFFCHHDTDVKDHDRRFLEQFTTNFSTSSCFRGVCSSRRLITTIETTPKTNPSYGAPHYTTFLHSVSFDHSSTSPRNPSHQLPHVPFQPSDACLARAQLQLQGRHLFFFSD